MPSHIPKTTLYRFPVLFGGFLLLAGTAFVYRDKFLGDIEEKRAQLYKECPESREMYERAKREYARDRQQA